ncbi:NHS-like protein 2 isoform X2 [Lepisosteus oculatus]|uniref:NHS-like protein 2 isoform X2 n=1 Tax=Lepisosteus oculatus TaxID=7918 RepID=UPI00371523A7
MPFCKRAILPRDVCKGDAKRQAAIFADLVDVCGFSLCSVLRQLSDLSRQSVSIIEELEGEIVSIYRRSGTLESKVISLQKHVSALATKPSRRTATNLDSESKRTAHFRSSWQQHVNVFSSSSRPECVEELHQEAQLNLQSLLQEFEEQLYDHKVTGQTFRHPSSQSSEDTSQSRSPLAASSKRTEFVFLPAVKQVCGDETTTVGTRLPDSDSSSPHTPDRHPPGWSKTFELPGSERPRWNLGRGVQAHIIPINVSGDGHAAVEQTFSADLTQGASTPETAQARQLSPSSETAGHLMPLRKTYSDLDQILSQTPGSYSSLMENSTMMCASPSWNGPKGSTFSPSWNNSFSYVLAASPVAKQPSQHEGALTCPLQGSSGLSMSSGSHSSSFTSISMEPSARAQTVAKRNDTEGGPTSPGQDKRTARVHAFKFRERSLSTPTDSSSFCSTDNICCDHRRENENYAMNYPSASSEDSASTDNASVVADPHGRPRQRSRSISLKKPKKKPTPPVRSVSLMKNKAGRKSDITSLTKEERPKSLFLPRDKDNLQNIFEVAPDFIDSKALRIERDLQAATVADAPLLGKEIDMTFPSHWQISEWKSNDPYRSLSSSSTATGTTVIECMKVRESSESLESPSTSRATSPSQLSTEAESKISPLKPPGLMSPSSGYSSQSETPTPTIPTSLITGPSPQGCKMRPKIPERKSSLPATSPREKSSRCRLSFELPVTTHLDLSSLKGKTKASRRHSDSSTSNKCGQKLSPSQVVMPVVTQLDLRSVRLRSVSRSEPDDNADGSSDIIEEEESKEHSITPQPKVKPPVAMKPPLPKRPPNLLFKSPSSSPLASESPPASPKDKLTPVENIYMVVRKPKTKKPQCPISPSSPQEYPELPIPSMKQGMDFVNLHSLPDREDKSKTLPNRIIVSSLTEMEKKKNKIPPPVPKKPNVLLLPASSFQANGTTDRPVITLDSCRPSGAVFPNDLCGESENHIKTVAASGNDSKQDPGEMAPSAATPTDTALNESVEESSTGSEKTALRISEEDDDVFIQTSTPHTTEDLFTIIHRSKRKVLGRREPADSFGSRQSLVSPVKNTVPMSEYKSLSLSSISSTPRSSSRNENFMALLQKKSNKPSASARVSAMELLKSTNPLARRVTEFSQSEAEQTSNAKPLPDH